MDVTDTLAPNSDRVTGDDFMLGAREFRIVRVHVIPMDERRDDDAKKYPSFIYLDGMGDKPWRPPVTLRRELAAAWGADSDNYPGKRVRLYRDPSVKLGREVKGGVRIEALSDLRSDAHKQMIPVGRGKKVKFDIPELAADPELVTRALNAIRGAADLAKLDSITAHAQKQGISGEVADAVQVRREELGNA